MWMKWLAAVLVASLGMEAHAAALDTIIIDAGRDRQTRIAVVPFRTADELEARGQLADIVAFDLARSGEFAPTKTENMLSYPGSAQEVFFRDWRVLGVEYLVVGRAALAMDGRTTVTWNLFHVDTERQLIENTIEAPQAKWRDVGHRISDLVYEEITGVRGAFSTRIVYVLAENSGTSYASYRLEIADSDGERSRTLFESKEPMMSPGWAPDARSVAYVSFETGRPTIVVQNLVTGARELLPRLEGINGSPVFSPDGRSLAMVSSRDGNPEIYLMDLTTRSLRRITRHPGIDTEPSWTPDGKGLVFTSERGGRPQIYQLELATNLVDRLTFEGDYNARGRLLDDGRHLVFVHRVNGIDHIAWQDLDRGDVRVLTETRLDESPSLAPNGGMLIYATQHQGRGILAVVSLDGAVKYRLPSSTGDVREPAWSPYMDALTGNL
jgi:TolB protein